MPNWLRSLVERSAKRLSPPKRKLVKTSPLKRIIGAKVLLTIPTSTASDKVKPVRNNTLAWYKVSSLSKGKIAYEPDASGASRIRPLGR